MEQLKNIMRRFKTKYNLKNNCGICYNDFDENSIIFLKKCSCRDFTCDICLKNIIVSNFYICPYCRNKNQVKTFENMKITIDINKKIQMINEINIKIVLLRKKINILRFDECTYWPNGQIKTFDYKVYESLTRKEKLRRTKIENKILLEIQELINKKNEILNI